MEKEVEDLLLAIGFITDRSKKFGSRYSYKNYVYVQDVMVNPNNDVIYFDSFTKKLVFIKNQFKN